MDKQDNNDILWELVEDTPNIYFNEFGVAGTQNDVIVILKQNGISKVVLNSSYIATKALARALLQAVNEFEKKADCNIPYLGTLEELSEEEND